jgi:DNA helicase HerA-like ATPase
VPGTADDKLAARSASIGQNWQATSFPVEFYNLGGVGNGIPIRTTVTDFGPLLLSKVLGLNETQESSLGLIFHWADTQSLALLDLKDLQATIAFLISDERKDELKGIGGLSPAMAGVILPEIVTLQSPGADVFFGEPAFSTGDLLRLAPDGRGLISALELPAVQDRPALFSTFLMWLVADLFHELPEVGDQDKPKLVFFFDEAHLLFTDASKAFLTQVTQTVRLIRSKGVGVFFVTQTPKGRPGGRAVSVGQPGRARASSVYPGRRDGAARHRANVPALGRHRTRPRDHPHHLRCALALTSKRHRSEPRAHDAALERADTPHELRTSVGTMCRNRGGVFTEWPY